MLHSVTKLPLTRIFVRISRLLGIPEIQHRLDLADSQWRDLKDPQKLMVKTGKTMVKVGTGGKAMVQDVLKTAVGLGQLIKEDLQSLTGGGSGGDSPPLSKKNTGGGRGGKGPGGG